MSRVLVVTPCPTHPAVEGNARRILNLVEALVHLGHDTHLLYLPHFMFSLPDLQAMREHWKERLHVGSPQWKWLPGAVRKGLLIRRERVRESLGALRRARPGLAAYDRMMNPHWERQARDLWRRYQFDVVIVEYVVISAVLGGIPRQVRKIIDTHDIFTERESRVSHVPRRLRWFATTREDEALGLSRADVVLAIQQGEADHFRQLTSNPVVTVGHLLGNVSPVGDPVRPCTVLMVASRNPINAHGLVVFLEKSWPLIRNAVPEATLRLVGTIGEAVAGDWPGLERLGIVENSAHAYGLGQVVINPVLEGTGLPIKSIESLACGKPLVTTQSGARGIEDAAGSAFLVAPTPAEFAGAIVRLLLDSHAREALSAAALRYALWWNERQIGNLRAALSGTLSAV